MNYDKEWDVIIVGAGPGGCKTAWEFAKRGVTTLLVDRKQQIGPPKRCGEGLSDRWVKTCGLPVDSTWAKQFIGGVVLISPKGKKIDIDVTGTSHKGGYIIERSQFEKALAAEAIRAGAKVMLKANVTGLLKDGGNAVGIRVEREGKEEEYHAKIVVAADGVDSRVARFAGMRTVLPLSECDSGYQYEMANVPIENPE
ncbi:MAG: NAD(P)/FAD-dependent oxidoreductase, partial [Candidatus Diapherotrites archaeon]|nr:NAD(P)/FAD-dependent oxidoreductase [Candidatus Diapherotrites archaeon]